ncbi:hotdog family protein [Paenibacillus macquariensis]|uniref:N-terminal of MaoC-like dehydratase domain-containing protein n=1 Tax=Paenibacillus macquariensis TaxID=948756 RepID=A0ABY1JQ20_9BACL|nr:hypothetical protein [Paenibacillus macquariensis]MEC0094079.1 hypothetical protein [Paenibacillus macquariensis]OAB37539.1 hypothetical protein PMSM_05640 [Paenibacillus macquariensis subsp. macquariensis]SIQ55875.1 hypothetical protein SAMN05421578_102561 [Paenibacillus macquariensis]
MNSVQHRLHITAEWITDYAQSIEAPLQRIHGDIIAPATMPIIFWQSFDIPWLNVEGPFIHGSQHFSYKAPIIAEMILDCELSLSKVEKKVGSQGDLTLYTHTLVCKCNGDLIVTADTVLIRVGDQNEETHNR